MRTREKSTGRGDPFLNARRPFKAILAPLGLWDAFLAMPRATQAKVVKLVAPAPMVAFEPSFPADPALRATLGADLAATTFEFAGTTRNVRDFYSVLVPCLQSANVTVLMPGHDKAVVRYILAARGVLKQALDDHLLPAGRAISRAINGPLFANSRHDTRHLASPIDCDVTPTGLQCVVRCRAIAPESRRVTLDGAGRTAYRVLSPYDNQWVSWPGEVLGRAGATPVYVQSHALRQLHARVDLPEIERYVESWLGPALTEPWIVERQAGGDLLVEFRVNELRLGYLVATPLTDCVVVRTFLFLTMSPSPESRRLAQRLKLTRRDADWLGLHALSAFARTDLHDDATLRPMLDACGCGHLFEMNDVDATPRAFAAEMKRYLRLAA